MPPVLSVITRETAPNPKLTVIWLHGLECTCCTESFIRSAHPLAKDVVLSMISLDYDDTDNALHCMLCGQLPVERFRELLIERYIASNADDIVWARTGLTVPRKSAMRALGDALAAPFPAFLTREAA